jgi:hypothetical protein
MPDHDLLYEVETQTLRDAYRIPEITRLAIKGINLGCSCLSSQEPDKPDRLATLSSSLWEFRSRLHPSYDYFRTKAEPIIRCIRYIGSSGVL